MSVLRHRMNLSVRISTPVRLHIWQYNNMVQGNQLLAVLYRGCRITVAVFVSVLFLFRRILVFAFGRDTFVRQVMLNLFLVHQS